MKHAPRSTFVGSARALCAVAGILMAGSAWSAEEIFLKLDGIRGSSTDARHAGEIVLSTYSQAFRNTLNFGFGSGAGAGRVSCGDITVVKSIDISSPSLIQQVVTGRHIASGTITFRRPNRDQPQEYYTVRLTDVIIDAIEQVEGTGDTGIQERVSLKARQFRFGFKPQNADGSLGAEQTFGWDCVSNTRL
jgi:type VI secretion system secreted protein Hcp